MDIQIRTVSEDELAAFFRATELAFSATASDDEIDRERRLAEPDRCFAAFDGPDIVGTAAALTMPMTVPGGEVQVGYVTAVGVRATHRRRGINTQLMRRQLDDAHERGELIDVLYASEGGIYGRYGYGLGALGLWIETETAHAGFIRGYESSGRLRQVERNEAEPQILAINDATRLVRPGAVKLDERRLSYWLSHEHGSDKDVPQLFILHEGLDGVDGYAVYRVKHDWPRGVPASTLELRDLQAASAGAYADLWRHVLDVDLVHKVEAWNRAIDEPLLHLVQEPRRLNARLLDALWVRPVDVAGCLRARTYDAEGHIVLDVVDRFCPWNEGRYLLESAAREPGMAERSDRPADLVCTVNDIGAVYLGGTTFRQLQRAGRVEERTTGALARADAIFAWDPAPWSPYEF